METKKQIDALNARISELCEKRQYKQAEELRKRCNQLQVNAYFEKVIRNIDYKPFKN